MGILVLLAAAALTAMGPGQKPPAQPPASPPQQTAPAPTGTAQISGVIKSAADDKPLARARVLAVSPALPEPRVVITGSDGRYAITELPAGAYTITAMRSGYAPQTYGQGRNITGTPISVTGTQQLAGIDIPLVPGAVIVGRILDEDGAPFAGATVDALVSRNQSGNDLLFSVATTQTDDRGEFRLFGLAPGPYYVSAADPAFTAVSTPKGVLHYSATYYPGTAQADQARTVTVTGTGQPPRVEFRLSLVPPSRVAGKLTAYDARQLINGAIIMSPLEGEGVPMIAPEEPQIFPDGRFTFNGVAPGHYQIRARGQTDPDAAALFAVFTIEVAGSDVDGIAMTLRPGAMLDGTLTVDGRTGAKPPSLNSLRVRAPFTDGNAFGDALTGTVQLNGTYVLRGIMKGTHQIVVDGLDAPWTLKSITYRGKNITDLQLPIEERETLHDVRIVVSDVGGEVTGVVKNSRDVPVANMSVLVFSKVPLFWMRTNRRMRVAYTDYQGRWRVHGLPAGEYVAVTSPMVDESDLGRRERLQALQTVGTTFRLESDEAKETITLHVASRVPAVPVR